MYAGLFSGMYMGMSGSACMSSFTNTFLFSFLDTFCFPADTLIETSDGIKRIADIKIDDILPATNSRVTATFRFYAKGQPMVKLGNTIVSTNHYVSYKNDWIMAKDHPEAINAGIWKSDEPLYCLNTDNHKIPIDKHTFLDYDETEDGDEDTMRMIESRVNGNTINNKMNKKYNFTEYGACFDENTILMLAEGNTKAVRDICIGDRLATGSIVAGIIKKEVTDITQMGNLKCTSSTLIWDAATTSWIRVGELYGTTCEKQQQMMSLVVVPNSQIEIEGGMRIRDYMELCSPDSEMYYTNHLTK